MKAWISFSKVLQGGHAEKRDTKRKLTAQHALAAKASVRVGPCFTHTLTFKQLEKLASLFV